MLDKCSTVCEVASGLTPREAGITGQRFSFLKTKLIIPVFALDRQSLKMCRPCVHIVPFGKFHRIGGAPTETHPNVKYDAPEEVGGDRKC